MKKNEFYIRRCFDLARLGAGSAASNPLVGAVLEYRGRIIGEGWYEKYGGAPAEVNALQSVVRVDRHLIAKSTLYISQEPCCVYGDTRSRIDLILEQNIKRVVISCIDDTQEAVGDGVKALEEAGVAVTVGVLAAEGRRLIQVYRTFIKQHRPYIILKWAQSKDGYIGKTSEQIWLTQSLSKRVVHKWRAESAAIMVGTNTALTDDPALTNRHYFGHSPLRIVLDRNGRLAKEAQLYNGKTATWIVSEQPSPANLLPLTEWKQLTFDTNLLSAILQLLAEAKKSTLIVEGGSQLLQSFIAAGFWDEARVLKTEVILQDGIAAPKISFASYEEFLFAQDKVVVLKPKF